MTPPSTAARVVPNRSWTAQDSFVAIIPVLIIALAVMFAPPAMHDGDPFLHVAAGQWMIAHRAVPHVDPFSYTFVGQPWNAHEWLSEVLMAAAYRLGGMGGLYMLFGLASVAAALGLVITLLRFLAPLPALVALTLPLAYLAGEAQSRPHILALPVLVFWVGELIAARAEQRAPSWGLIPLMALWVNLHASFVLGLGLLGVFAFEAAWVSWLPILAGAILAAFLNPAGVSGFLFPWKFMAEPGLSMMIGEWQSAFFVGPSVFLIWLLGMLGFCLFRGVKAPPVRLFLLIGLLYEALQHQRHILVLIFVGTMLLAEPIADALGAKVKTEVVSLL